LIVERAGVCSKGSRLNPRSAVAEEAAAAASVGIPAHAAAPAALMGEAWEGCREEEGEGSVRKGWLGVKVQTVRLPPEQAMGGTIEMKPQAAALGEGRSMDIAEARLLLRAHLRLP
jgi:hypothetical protein